MGIGVQRARLSLVFGASLTFVASGGDSGSKMWSTSAGTLPTTHTITRATTATYPPPASASASASSSVKNSAPFIKGAPEPTILQDTPYVFVPDAVDGDGDILTFKISNLPHWAQFEPITGRLYGTPSPADVGTYADIRITVTDGADDAALQPFSITVAPVATGAVELSWAAPAENADGSALTDLAGYKIYWGTQPDSLTNSITIANPAVLTYVLENLVPATYYFVTTAFDADGVESGPSQMTRLTIS